MGSRGSGQPGQPTRAPRQGRRGARPPPDIPLPAPPPPDIPLPPAAAAASLPARRLLPAEAAGRGLARRFHAGASGACGPPRPGTHAAGLEGAARRLCGRDAGLGSGGSTAERRDRCTAETHRRMAPGLVCFVLKSDSFFPSTVVPQLLEGRGNPTFPQTGRPGRIV